MHTRNKKQIAESFEIVYHRVYKKMNQHIHRRCYNQGNIHIVNLMIPRLIDEMTYTNLKFKLGQDDSSFFRFQARIRSGIYRFLLIITCPSVNYSRLFLIFSQMPSKLRGSRYYWMAEGRTNGEAYCRVVELRGVRTEYLVSANMKYLNTRPEIHHHLTANIH